MKFDIITLFPEIFSGYIGQSLLHKAIQSGLISVDIHNLRQFAANKHQKVDDRPFGGGPGMVLMVQPIVDCVDHVLKKKHAAVGGPPSSCGVEAGTQEFGRAEEGEPQSGPALPSQGNCHLVMLSPQGRRLTQSVVEELAQHQSLVLICGRYEGFDERVKELLHPDEISIGDYVLNGGETAAMVIIDAVMRLIPGVLGDEDSSRLDSFSSDGRLLEHPQYTRPRVFRGLETPEVLLSGDHQAVAQWRAQESTKRTKKNRPDLLGPE